MIMYLELEVGTDEYTESPTVTYDRLAGPYVTWVVAESAPNGTYAEFPIVRFSGTKVHLTALRDRWLKNAGDVDELPEITTYPIRITSEDLQRRGEYWIERLSTEYDLHVLPGEWSFVIRRLRGIYGETSYRPRQRIRIHEELIKLADYALLDEMLVHELIHATKPKGPSHGPEFKRRYAKVYPWAKPGPVTEFDDGTPRRVLWSRISRALPRTKLTR
jgi:hypothetical protein